MVAEIRDLREVVGIGGSINPNHEGPEIYRRTEEEALRKIGKLTSKDIRNKQLNKQVDTKSAKTETVKTEEKNPNENEDKLSSFEALLFSPNETQEIKRNKINEAGLEIVKLIQAPFFDAKRTLSQLDGNSDIRPKYEEGLAVCKETLRFFNDFCTKLRSNGSTDGSTEAPINLSYESEKNGGYKLSFKIDKGIFGRIKNEDVSKVEIIIRPNNSNNDNGYTPMQLNFQFFGTDNESEATYELNSLRVDLHDIKGEELIQVDSRLGGVYVEKKHQNIQSLCSAKNPREAFRDFQAAFMINFVDKLLADGVDDSGIKYKPFLNVNDPNKMIWKKFVSAAKRLDVTVKPSITTIIQVENELLTKEKAAREGIFNDELVEGIANELRVLIGSRNLNKKLLLLIAKNISEEKTDNFTVENIEQAYKIVSNWLLLQYQDEGTKTNDENEKLEITRDRYKIIRDYLINFDNGVTLPENQDIKYDVLFEKIKNEMQESSVLNNNTRVLQQLERIRYLKYTLS